MSFEKFLKIFFLLTLIFTPLQVSAANGHIKLLSVSSNSEKETGGTADLFLEVKSGSGRIFIDSFPLTKLDTQISTRFSNQVACEFLNEDCSKYDFFYTIRANSAIVGGPSAGSAITILTIAVLDDLKLDEKTVITGTINSGEVIGVVGGINEKIITAARQGFEKVLIPKWQLSFNESLIKKELGNKSITVVKISNIRDALFHFTGKNYDSRTGSIILSEKYLNRMKSVSEKLCERTVLMQQNIPADFNKYDAFYKNATSFYKRALESEKVMDYYSKASLCFSANIKLQNVLLSNKTVEEKKHLANQNIDFIRELNFEIEKKELLTLSDLETFMIVKERLVEAEDFLRNSNLNNLSAYTLGYSIERAYSAYFWSDFFGLKGEILSLDDEHLKNGCLKKISEAEERINYIDLYLPGISSSAQKELNYAYNDYYNEDFELCIFKASKAKAEANIMMTAMGITLEQLDSMIEEKLSAIEQIILKEFDKDFFPIIGYSYYEYSKTLKEEDPGLSLMFSEYALELSNLDVYFPSEKKNIFGSNFFWLFCYEILIGFLLTIIIILISLLFKKQK
ncbi:MAG: S16 family serine protease [Nanoarchaeota archaeon]|nr:hypothetical protein [Nanoarchaeota archaeon]MBU1030087.1 hypothetical protein [Nanoarchaeota archaeon]MBU1849951.1 hypothetical protein [Nanoarchaeota archaeon]